MKMISEIEGFEEFVGYGITSCGKVWSFKTNKFLTPFKNNDGYLQIQLSNGKQRKTVKIHRLVALAYISNPNNYDTVDHINSCKEHNYINNLQWMTNADNVCKSISKKVYCVELDKTFESCEAAAKELGIHKSNVSAVCLGKRKTTGGYHFQYI